MNFDVSSILPHLRAYSEPRDEAAAVHTTHQVGVNHITFSDDSVRLDLSERGKERGVRFIVSISHAGLLALLAGFNSNLTSKLEREVSRANEEELNNEAAKTALEELADGLLSLVADKNLTADAIDELLGGHEYGFQFAPHAISRARAKTEEG